MDRWTFEHVKRRAICLKMMKQVLQQNGRYAHLQVPRCETLMDLYSFMQTVWSTPTTTTTTTTAAAAAGRQRHYHSSMEHCFKPSSRNRQGKPTLCWSLVQQKLDKFMRLAAMHVDSEKDLIEIFVQTENERHRNIAAAAAATTTALSSAVDDTASKIAASRSAATAAAATSIVVATQSPAGSIAPQRKHRRLANTLTTTTTTRQQSNQVKCSSCNDSLAQCICLDNTCPFHQQASCYACFAENHPILLRGNHERIPLDDDRAKAVLRQTHRQNQKDAYCPEFASGGFAILCALLEVMQQHHQHQQHPYQRRPQVLSLTESRLKELAQPRCRSNLYDRQARGRTAFACVEGLPEKDLIRKEIIPGQAKSADEGECAKYSLLPKGEALAKCCLAFEQSIRSVTLNDKMVRDRQEALTAGVNRSNVLVNSNDISLIVDTREDKTFVARLLDKCRAVGVDCKERELPAGDYLFTTQIGSSEMVLPLVIERKTWSDLADSVKGCGRRRLDCVRIEGDQQSGSCDARHCQLCKMKRSKCPKIMFIIEGARCLSRDGQEDKCTSLKRCKYCRELQERHGQSMIHSELEKVLYRLQAEQNCLVHFTRSYNETITSLHLLREIMGAVICRNQAGASADDPEDDMARAIALSLAPSPRTYLSKALPTLQLTYKMFCSNARRITDNITTTSVVRHGAIVEWTANDFVENIYMGKSGARLSETFGRESGKLASDVTNVTRSDEQYAFSDDDDRKMPAIASSSREVIHLDSGDESEQDELNESQASIEMLGVCKASSKSKAHHQGPEHIINIDSDEDSDGELLDGSQESVLVVGCVPGNRKNAGQNKNKLNQSHDSVEILDSFPAKKLAAVRSAPRKRKAEEASDIVVVEQRQRKVATKTDNILKAIVSAAEADNKIQLFLITGLYEYDQEYHTDANKIWKQLYATQSDERSDFAVAAMQQLMRLQESETPFIDRESIMFWILYSQIRYGIVFHAPRKTSCRDELRKRWNNSSTGTNADHQSVGTNGSVLAVSTPRTLRGACILCKGELISDIQTIPCGHSFHFSCMRNWLATSLTCPVCRKSVEPMKNPGRNSLPIRTPTSTQTSPSAKSPACPQSSHCNNEIREARLKRFAGLPPTAPMSSVARLDTGTPLQWTCTRCTLSNDSSSSRCGACAASRVPGGASRASTPQRKVDVNLARNTPGMEAWNCDKCTLLNADIHARICRMCGSENPFRAKEENSEVFSAPSVARKPPPPVLPASMTTASGGVSKVKCGACGQLGHNRGTATAQTCPAYYSEEEVQRRNKKKEEAERKAREARDKAERLRLEEEKAKEHMEKIERAMAEMKRTQENRTSITQNEIRRLEKDRARAEKRARKLG